MLLGCSSKEEEANKIKEMHKKELAAMERLEQLEKESELNSLKKGLDINKLKNEKWYIINYNLNKCDSQIGNLGDFIDNLNAVGKEYKVTDVMKVEDMPIVVDLTMDVSPIDGPRYEKITTRYFRGNELCNTELNKLNNEKNIKQKNDFENSKKYK